MSSRPIDDVGFITGRGGGEGLKRGVVQHLLLQAHARSWRLIDIRRWKSPCVIAKTEIRVGA